MLWQSLLIGAFVLSLSVFFDLLIYAWRRLRGCAPCSSADVANRLVHNTHNGICAALGAHLLAAYPYWFTA